MNKPYQIKLIAKCLYIRPSTIHIADIMTGTRVKEQRHVENAATKVPIRFVPVVIDGVSDRFESAEKGHRFTLEELPQYLKVIIKLLENTRSYKEDGCVSFRLDTIGTNMPRYSEFNPEGQTLQEMFKSVSKSEYSNLLFNKSARFFHGDEPLVVTLLRAPDGLGGRVNVVGNFSPQLYAPVVVVKHVAEDSSAVVVNRHPATIRSVLTMPLRP